MKRLHIHVSVEDLDQSIHFYSTLLGQAPTVRKDDYAKWRLDDPAINLAVSEFDQKPGLTHLGFDVETDEEGSLVRASTPSSS